MFDAARAKGLALSAGTCVGDMLERVPVQHIRTH